MAVRGADVGDRSRLFVEVSHRIRAEQRERMTPLKLVPQLLEADGGVAVPCLPEDVDHLSVGPQAGRCVLASADARHQTSYRRVEEFAVRQSTSHELGEHFVCIQEQETTLREASRDLD